MTDLTPIRRMNRRVALRGRIALIKNAVLGRPIVYRMTFPEGMTMNPRDHILILECVFTGGSDD